MRLDFNHTHDLLDELFRILDQLEHVAVEADPITGSARHNNPLKAQVSRDLLRAADLADAVSTEVRMQYWRFKGKEDPREAREAAG